MIRVLIFGGSSSIGTAIFKELNPFYDLHATYYKQIKFSSNKRYLYYDLKDDPVFILNKLNPDIIISGLKGNFNLQVKYYDKIIKYCEAFNSKLMFISSSSVFDSFVNFPSYEEDKTFSQSIYGRFNIHIENKLFRMKSSNWTINRSAMIFSSKSKRIDQIKESIINLSPIEIFPNLIININSENLLAKHLHYMISRNLNGIFHHGSKDLINHEELIKIIIEKLNLRAVKFKYVYTTNNNRYISLLSNKNSFPKHLNFTFDSILEKID
ncbi:MAG: dTDP-4-dehydrorhamnose reductase [Flavobacteriales bacterium]|jgi:dTDP-4-dehydrorhamnose reductase|nr:MAG: dTDP-4-dehydrorhamnose reductase [Flavobacteriales bacterium]